LSPMFSTFVQYNFDPTRRTLEMREIKLSNVEPILITVQ
jgi:hypothetical protein